MGRTSNAELMEKTKLQEEILSEKESKLQEEKDKNESMRVELDNMKQMMEQMQKMMHMQNQIQPHSTPAYQEEKEYYIGSNQMGELRVYIDNREYSFRGGEAGIPFDKNEVKALTKHPRYAKLFRNGILFFEDNENYDEFRVHPYIKLDDDSLDELLNKDEKEIDNILRDVMQKSDRPDMIKQTITFKVAKHQHEGKITNINKFNTIVNALGIKTPMLIVRQYLVAKEVKFY